MVVRLETRAEPIPGYRLIERLGGGGFGEVWKAEAPGGLLKAIKFVFGDLQSAGDAGGRAEQELKALKRVQSVRHPYILSLERYDIIDGQLMIVTELADRNLWDRFKECRAQGLEGIPHEELLQYMEESAEALDLMNGQYQLQHLDIKPQNLFLVRNHLKVADFGLVKDLSGLRASVTGGVTPVYAAPETFDGWVSRYCDQYSLAIVYMELLTGCRPFNGTTVRQLILQHLQAAPNLSPLPEGDQAIIGRALSKVPDERFPTCGDLVRALRQSQSRPSEAAVPAEAGILGPGAATVADRDDLPRPQRPGDSVLPNVSGPSTPPLNLPPGASDSEPSHTRLIRAASAPGTTRPAEATGDGILFPTLIVGLGQMGLQLLQRLRQRLVTEFGALEQVPCLRLLLLDTDPDTVRPAAGRPATPLPPTEVLVSPLNRPSYYFKPRDGKAGLESWLKFKMLYRIPRSQQTTGVRALGRLAFCDNFRLIQRRLQAELEACLQPEALQAAACNTGLGLRTNRPRVYVLAGLAGGTGSGMFLDLAYTIRQRLKALGFEKPDVVGLLLAPPVDGHRTRTMAVGNAYAALTELNYFGSPDTVFSACYLDGEPPVKDAEPPFSRTILLPLPDETDEQATRALVDLATQFLYSDLCTPLGRAAELARAGLSMVPWRCRGQFYNTFGMYQLTWPRRALLKAVASQLTQQLVRRWLSRDSKPVRDLVQTWVHEQWAAKGLGAEFYISGLREALEGRLGQAPETIFSSLIEPLAAKAEPAPGSKRRAGTAVELTPQEIADVLGQIQEWLGRPNGDSMSEQVPKLLDALRSVGEEAIATWAQRLIELPVQLIEEPAYRLAGAEEATRHLIATIEQVLQHQEPLARDLAEKAAAAYAQLQLVCGQVENGRRRPTLTAREVVELLQYYAKYRLHSQIMYQVLTAYLELRGHLSDEMREISYCRVRLGELLRQLESADPAGPEALLSLVGKPVFPSGGVDLRQAIQDFQAGLSPDVLNELDVPVQEMIRQNFTALIHICMDSLVALKNVEAQMLDVAERFAAGLLAPTDAAQIVLEQPIDDWAGIHAQANPSLVPGHVARAGTLSILQTPPGPAGESVREQAASALEGEELEPVTSGEDIVLYREFVNLPLRELPQMGPVGQSAYRLMNSTDNFTPHTRSDIDFDKVAAG
jgi:serine/threonine protein kinase